MPRELVTLSEGVLWCLCLVVFVADRLWRVDTVQLGEETTCI